MRHTIRVRAGSSCRTRKTASNVHRMQRLRSAPYSRSTKSLNERAHDLALHMPLHFGEARSACQICVMLRPSFPEPKGDACVAPRSFQPRRPCQRPEQAVHLTALHRSSSAYGNRSRREGGLGRGIYKSPGSSAGSLAPHDTPRLPSGQSEACSKTDTDWKRRMYNWRVIVCFHI